MKHLVLVSRLVLILIIAVVFIAAPAAAAPDITPPETTLTVTPSNPHHAAAAVFEFTSNEAGTFECSLDGAAFAACTSPHIVRALADGSHTFLVRAIDSAGNIDPTPASFTFIVDPTPIDTAFTVTPANYHAAAAALFEFVSSEPGTFECSLDGAAFAACTSPHIVRALADGSHTFQVRAIDTLGYPDSTPASFTFIVDTTAPDTTLTVTPSDPHNSSDASFEFTSNEPGTFECSMDGAAFAACTTPHTATGLADGSHTFAVRAIDAASNVDASPATYTFTVNTVVPDTTAPETTITEMPATPHNSSSANFKFSSSEAGTFECSMDGAAFAACTSPHTVTGLADGSHTFQVRAIDAASNVDATPASYTFTVNTAVPPAPPVVVTPAPVVTELPPPPPDELLAASNFEGSNSGVRAGVPDHLRAFINFSVIVENSSYVTWNNGQLTSVANLGNQGVADLGVMQAVNVYSPSGMQKFDAGIVVCLRGEGYMLWKPDGSVTNQYFWVETYTVDEFPGFTCVTIFEAGILALVSEQPTAP